MTEKTKVMLVVVGTGETVECEIRTDMLTQFIDAFQGTAKSLDRAALGLGKSRNDQFIKMNQTATSRIYDNSKYSKMDAYIWGYCLAHSAYGGEIKQTQVDIAEALGVNRITVAKSFKTFRDLKMIEKYRLIRGTPSYRITSALAIKGKDTLEQTGKMSKVVRLDLKRQELEDG